MGGTVAPMGPLEFLGLLICCSAILGAIVFWVWMIIDCAVNEPGGSRDKIVWILVILLAHWVGALVYYFVRRPQRIAQYGK